MTFYLLFRISKIGLFSLEVELPQGGSVTNEATESSFTSCWISGLYFVYYKLHGINIVCVLAAPPSPVSDISLLYLSSVQRNIFTTPRSTNIIYFEIWPSHLVSLLHVARITLYHIDIQYGKKLQYEHNFFWVKKPIGFVGFTTDPIG